MIIPDHIKAQITEVLNENHPHRALDALAYWAFRLDADDRADLCAWLRVLLEAPDLLEALERLADAVKDYAEYHGPSEDHHPDDCPDDDCQGCAMDLSVNGAVNAARAAIAKARGTRGTR